MCGVRNYILVNGFPLSLSLCLPPSLPLSLLYNAIWSWGLTKWYSIPSTPPPLILLDLSHLKFQFYRQAAPVHCHIAYRTASWQPSHVACVSEDLKCWGARDTTCGHKATDITASIDWRRETSKEEAIDDLSLNDERGPSSVRRTLELQFSKATLGKLLKNHVERICLFPSA